jgi:hypothetical protein
MSRGAGHIQRTILALIADQPHGAWSTSDLCDIVYGRGVITKAQRVAVTRALRRMTLPGTWCTEWCGGWRRDTYENYLCDPCDLQSMSFKVTRLGCDPAHLEPGGIVHKAVQRAKRWRDASPVERIDMEIEVARDLLEDAERVAELQAEKARLIDAERS